MCVRTRVCSRVCVQMAKCRGQLLKEQKAWCALMLRKMYICIYT